MNEPTLADVPRILFRTALRAVARLILAAASICIILGFILAVISLLIATWRSPRTTRIQLATNLMVAFTAFVKEFRAK